MPEGQAKEVKKILDEALRSSTDGLMVSLSRTRPPRPKIPRRKSWDIATPLEILEDLQRAAKPATMWGPIPYRVNVPMPTRRQMEDAAIIERLNESLRSGAWLKR